MPTYFFVTLVFIKTVNLIGLVALDTRAYFILIQRMNFNLQGT
jgi:hypothetical protein